jgi:hypothetical protein
MLVQLEGKKFIKKKSCKKVDEIIFIKVVAKKIIL